MTEDEFWTLIEESRRAFDPSLRDGNMDRQVELLTQALSALPVESVQEFDRVFHELFWRAYRWDLWDAAFIIQAGCSDDGFTDFRNWLISAGRAVFEDALADPETLAVAAAAPGVEVCAFEEFGSIARGVLDDRGVTESPPAPEASRRTPSGARLEDGTLPDRFPRLWAAFGTR